MVAYRYALDEDGKIVSIDDISIETEVRLFICGECREKLAPRAVNSNKVTAHFYHPYSDTSVDRMCSGESYLHWISKELLAESLQCKKPFLLTWETSSSCENKDADWGMCYKELQHNIDLIKEYPIVSIEKRDGSFVPDILLSNEKGDKLYIEIYNNSPCSIEKRNSGNKIIEIKVTNEVDIENIINSRSINEKYEAIELINFNLDKTEEYFDCRGKCHFITEIEETPPLPEILSVSTEDRDLQSVKFISEQSISYFEVFFNIDRDHKNTIIIEILNRMWYFYKDGLKAVKERASSYKFKVLYRGSENNFTFVGYKGKYYGAVFLENKYFLYMEKNNKIFIICQVKDIASIPKALNEMQSAF